LHVRNYQNYLQLTRMLENHLSSNPDARKLFIRNPDA
jgi:hypothetical protein